MVIVVRGGPVRRRPVMAGLVVGGAVASNRARNQAQAQASAAQQQAAASQAQADMLRAEAERKERNEREDERMALERERLELERQRTQMAAPSTKVSVIIPLGVQPGQQFQIQMNGQIHSVICPYGAMPGQNAVVDVPTGPQAVAIVQQPQPSLQQSSSSGKDLFRQAMTGGGNSTDLVMKSDHIVDEAAMSAYGIISVPAGTFVTLVEGDLVNGLGGAYKDYIKVSVPVQGGRVGLISRMVVAPALVAPSAPPPASY